MVQEDRMELCGQFCYHLCGNTYSNIYRTNIRIVPVNLLVNFALVGEAMTLAMRTIVKK